jgi:hypothetical protein
MTAKETSSRYEKFVERHGENVFELEAVPPNTLQEYLRQAIDSVLDLEAFNTEIDKEKQDAAFLDTVRQRAHASLGKLHLFLSKDHFGWLDVVNVKVIPHALSERTADILSLRIKVREDEGN